MDSGKKRKQQQLLDIKKAYDEVNREKTLEQLENIRMQERIMEFIRELISERWIMVRVGR